MAAARKMRAFKGWMRYQGTECSEALLLLAENGDADYLSISVKALCGLKEGDVVARIPKHSCLTVKTSAARHLIEEAELGGNLGLAFALMYEKSLGTESKWFQYLELLPSFEPIPLLWSLSEIDSFLSGTELHKTVKEDKALVYQDWKECIKLLLGSDSFELNPKFFTVDEYFAAKRLVASRAFEIDEYHGFGMVPLADLFNHKTAAEDAHFTSVSSSSDSDSDTDNGKRDANDENDGDDEVIATDIHSETGAFDGSDLELAPTAGDDATSMEMIIVKDVKAGTEVFNTYGPLGNAALLHRYGFTQTDNPFDILNIDLDIVIQWSLSLFSCRHSRRRLSLWRKLDHSGCVSQDSEYFEISFDGEPQVELLVLLYMMLLLEDEFHEIELSLSATVEVKETLRLCLLGKERSPSTKDSKLRTNLLLTQGVCQALFWLADARESFYGANSLEDNIRSFSKCCRATDPNLYYSLMLRIGKKRIIQKLRSFAASGAGSSTTAEKSQRRKRLERA